MYKIYYKWSRNVTNKEGFSESIVGADSEQEAIQLLKEANEEDGYSLVEVLDLFQLHGKGVLVSSTRH